MLYVSYRQSSRHESNEHNLITGLRQYAEFSDVTGNTFEWLYGLTTPNASLIKTHVNCLNSAGRIHYFLLYEPYSVAYQDKALNVLVQKQDRYGYADQTDFELCPLAWKNINTA